MAVDSCRGFDGRLRTVLDHRLIIMFFVCCVVLSHIRKNTQSKNMSRSPSLQSHHVFALAASCQKSMHARSHSHFVSISDHPSSLDFDNHGRQFSPLPSSCTQMCHRITKEKVSLSDKEKQCNWNCPPSILPSSAIYASCR